MKENLLSRPLAGTVIGLPKTAAVAATSGARCPARDLLAGRGVEAEDKLQAVGAHAQ
jgi:hypothetical protein